MTTIDNRKTGILSVNRVLQNGWNLGMSARFILIKRMLRTEILYLLIAIILEKSWMISGNRNHGSNVASVTGIITGYVLISLPTITSLSEYHVVMYTHDCNQMHAATVFVVIIVYARRCVNDLKIGTSQNICPKRTSAFISKIVSGIYWMKTSAPTDMLIFM